MKTDLQLQREVLNEIRATPELARSEIGIAAKGGVITLTGLVDKYSEKLAAESCAERVSGVLGVADDIEVKTGISEDSSDSAIAHAAVHALLWDIQVPQDCIKVAVDDGWVDLIGEVEWEYQRHAAEAAVRRIRQVRGINNLLTLKPRGAEAREPAAPLARAQASAAAGRSDDK